MQSCLQRKADDAGDPNLAVAAVGMSVLLLSVRPTAGERDESGNLPLSALGRMPIGRMPNVVSAH